MLTVEEIDDFKAKLQTKMLEVAIKQAEAELQYDIEGADCHEKAYRFLSIFRTAIFEEDVYNEIELEKIIPFVIHYGKLSDVVPVSFTGFTNITNNFGGGGVITIANVIGLQAILNLLQSQIDDMESVYTDDIVVSLSNGKTVGRWTNGQTIPLKGKTMQEGMEIIAIEEQFPTYTAPSGSLISSITGTVEQGVTITTFLDGIFNQADAGEINGFEIERNGDTIYSDSTQPIRLDTEDNIVAVEGTISYVAKFSYSTGNLKLTTPGNEPYYTGRILAGTVASPPVNIEVILPWFYGSESTNVIPNIYSGTKALASASGQLNVPSFGVGIKFPWFAVPRDADSTQRKAFTTWFRNEIDKGAIGGSTNLFKSPVIISVTSTGLTNNWTRDYDLYFANYATEAGTATTLN